MRSGCASSRPRPGRPWRTAMLAEAQRRYEAMQAEFPHDPVARHLLAHAAKATHQPAAGS